MKLNQLLNKIKVHQPINEIVEFGPNHLFICFVYN